LQICIYDNDSGDETSSVVAAAAKGDARIQYFCHEQNVGSARNFQFGLARVRTPMFAFLSDDDYLLPSCYRVAVAGFQKCPSAMFSSNRVLNQDEGGRIINANPRWEIGCHAPPQGLLSMIQRGWPIWTGTVFRTVLRQCVGDLDLDVTAIDADFLVRIAARYPYVLNEEVGAIFASRSLAHPGGIPRFSDFWPRQMKTIDTILNDSSLPWQMRQDAAVLLTELFRRALFKTGMQYLYQQRFSEARQAAGLYAKRFSGRRDGILLDALVRLAAAIPALTNGLVLGYAVRHKLQRRSSTYQDIVSDLALDG